MGEMPSDQPEVMILGRKDCTLCEAALEVARTLQPELRFILKSQSIDDDPVLSARYGIQVPVVFVDDAEIGWGQITTDLLREAVKRARRRRPISRILSRLGLRQRR
jgi:glutaredoxin